MATVFTPEHNALDRVFGTDTTYVIPEYQRPYSWQALGKSDKTNQINQMWEDLWAFFQDNEDDKEYFLGSMVVIQKGRRTLEVIDGQQRLTSLVLLFAAMRCFLQQCLAFEGERALSEGLANFAKRGIEELSRLIYNTKSIGLAPELKVKIERSEGNDFDTVLNHAAACRGIETIDSIRARDADSEYQEIATRYFKNRDYFRERIEETFLENEHFTFENAQVLDRFFRFLQTRVAIVTITTTDFDTAFAIFEILNNRGLPLTNKDLLRNFVINEFSKAGDPDGAKKWYALESNYELTEDFTGRWVESVNASKQRYSAFNDIKAIYQANYASDTSGNPVEPPIQRFYGDLQRDLGYYSLLVEEDLRIQHLGMRHRIKLIKQLDNLRYSNDLLLALLRFYAYTGGEPDPALEAFMGAYQRYALYWLLAPGRRFSSSKIFQAIRFLRSNKPEEARNVFELSDQDRQLLVEHMSGQLDNAEAKLLLAVYVWHEQATKDDVVVQSLQYEKATLEHILPQTPAKGTNWLRDFSSDFRKEFTYRLGNMTLLTTKMNSAVKNHDFSKKQEQYKKTHLAMTHELAALKSIDEQFIRDRHQRLIAGLREHLGL